MGNLSIADVFWNCVAGTALVIFGLRFILQWIASERRKQSIVPVSFWYVSLAGGVLLTAYAVFRDPVVLVSAAPSVAIYARNIALLSRANARALSLLGLAVLLAAAASLMYFGPSWSEWLSSHRARFWQTPTDVFWFIFGFAGQTVFFMRFVWQWIASERRGESVIPVAFWYFSLVGGLMLTVYYLFCDIVLVPGQAPGLVVYIRNLMLIRRAERAQQAVGTPQQPPDSTQPETRQAA